MKNTLRTKLFEWFLLFSVLIVICIVPIHLIQQKNQSENNAIKSAVNQLQLITLESFQAADQFLRSGKQNDIFYITGTTTSISSFNNFYSKSDSLIQSLLDLSTGYPENFPIQLSEIHLSLTKLNRTFDSLVQSQYHRGYGNFGLAGKLNGHRLALQEQHNFPYSNLMRLQNMEQKYLLNPGTLAANNLILTWKHLAEENNATSANKWLQQYRYTFNQLAEYDRIIGYNGSKGLLHDFETHRAGLNDDLATLNNTTKMHHAQYNRALNIIYILLLAVIVILSMAYSFIVSRRLSHPLIALTSYIQELTRNNFHYPPDEQLRKANKEISLIYKEFRNLVTQMYIRENQRDKALQRASESERKYRELAEMLPQCIFETDFLGNYTFTNDEWKRTFGYTEKEIQEGINLIETLSSQKGERIMADVQLINSDFTAIRKDKTQFPAAVYINNIVKDGKTIGKRGIIIDVTERNNIIRELQAERNKARNADKLKSHFLANMSHEIRTPMNSIIGFSHLLNSPEISDKDKNQFINHIKSSGELLLNLIDDIIDIAKIEAGEIKLVYQDCHLNKLFSELNETFIGYKQREDKKHIKLFSTTPDQDIVIHSDPFRLKQILYNLLSNAIKFTNKGEVTFGFTEQGNQIHFYVSDTGIGLTQDKLNYIFERFKQLESSGKSYKGAGLGLAITKNLVELLGGKLHVESTPGKGTRFAFEIPVRISKQITSEKRSRKPDNEILEYNWQAYTILIAEDENQNFALLEESLKSTGCKILRAHDGAEAVEMALEQKVDLILMDVQLPVLDGYEATSKIKNKKPKLPIIAQTAHAMANEKHNSLMAGCDDYMAKPLVLDKLLPKMAQFLSGHTKKHTSNNTISNPSRTNQKLTK